MVPAPSGKANKGYGIQTSTVDKWIFYRGKTLYALYTEDLILMGTDQEAIEQIIEDIKREKLILTLEGDLQDFLGVNTERQRDGTINLAQPHLTDQTLTDLHLE